MPLYEYRCDDCAREFEELVGASSASQNAVRCPACGSGSVQKLLSVFGVGSSSPPGCAEVCEGGSCPYQGGGAAGPARGCGLPGGCSG